MDYTDEKLQEILDKHEKWLRNEGGGIRANLTGANLRDADLEPIKKDFYEVLSAAPLEIEFLKKHLKEGKINGTTYNGECCCLNGTIANGAKNKEEEKSIIACRDASRPIERLFLAIRPGDTPENHPVTKIVMEWIEEFQKENEPKK